MMVILLAFITIPVSAQWSSNPDSNTIITSQYLYYTKAAIMNDDAGGAFIAWVDSKNYTTIYVQRINADGVPLWTTNGLAIPPLGLTNIRVLLVTDGARGAIVISQSTTAQGLHSDIHAQRINASGTALWGSSGVTVFSDYYFIDKMVAISDGTGGAIITWADEAWDIYAQRINGSGTKQWAQYGVPITTAANTQSNPVMVSDGAGGALIAWQDLRGGSYYDIYAQRINSNGVRQWSVSAGDSNGIVISNASYDQNGPAMVSDDNGGSIITWTDNRSGNPDIYAQRIDPNHNVYWAANGVAVCVQSGEQNGPQITNDGESGAIITWSDYRNGTDFDIYAQRLSPAGAAQWTANGVAMETESYEQSNPAIMSDGASGAIIVWQDKRNGYTYDIYGQRVTSTGSVNWNSHGAKISTAPDDQMYPALAMNGVNGAVVIWADQRTGGSYQLYAQNVDQFGYLGDMSPHLQAVKDVPNDQGGKVSLLWSHSYIDTYPDQTLSYYIIWRGITASKAAPGSTILNREEYMRRLGNEGALKQDASVSGGKPIYMKMAGTSTVADDIYWERITTVTTHWLSGYTYTASTLSDSGPQGTASNYFMITAYHSSLIFWDSPPMAGYSVDNLSPSPALSLAAAAQPGPSVALHWEKNAFDPDVNYYELYRSTTPGFAPTPAAKVGQTTDTALVDAAPAAGYINYYRLVTVDIHGNRSLPSTQAVTTVQTTQQYSMLDKWNMVSVPLSVDNYAKAVLFPSAVSDAFAYNAGYASRANLSNGVGYWVKFSPGQNVSMVGVYRMTDTFAVVSGWNMVGSISKPVTVSSITSDPPGLIMSQFFMFRHGYESAENIEPGKGYWVKAEQAGKIILSASVVTAAEAGKIRIVPTLEAPPSPPGQNNNGSVELPLFYAMEQNYPNPFNPATLINYALPENSYVHLTIYNMLGQVIATLVDESKEAGYQTTVWNASKVASGLYFYRLDATSVSDPMKQFSQTRKMVLIK
jgi:hypothetical protein